MCGLVGIFTRSEINSKPIEAALQRIHYRGKDDQRIFTFNNNRPRFFSTAQSAKNTQQKFPGAEGAVSDCWLGFNRLAIVDRSATGMQPFWDEASQTSFMMVGEMYNYRNVFQQFFSANEQQQFFSQTDTEVAFRLYLKLGKDFIHHVQGMFTIVITDHRRQKVLVFRDKIGMKPVFYSHDTEQFIVASEAGAILSSGLVQKKLNSRGLAYLLYFESSPWESSIYNQIVSLPPGHSLELDLCDFALKKFCYWHLNYDGKGTDSSVQELENDVLETTALHLTGNVKKGISLSGGIDSGVLAYALGKQDDGIKAFSLNPSDSDSDESVYAALSARNASLEFENIRVPASPPWSQFQAFLTSEDEPNNTPEPNYMLCREIMQQGVSVLYSALGPDEIFGGYSYYQQVNKYRSIKRLTGFLPFISHEKLANLKRFGLLYLPSMKRETASWSQIKSFFPDESGNWQHPYEYQLDKLLEANPEFINYPDLKQLSYWDLNVYIGAHHTYRADQSAMRSTIEMRFPFLDADFVSKYFNRTDIFKNIGTTNKPTFRRLAAKVMPKAVQSMPKKGFSIPSQAWLRQYQEQVKDLLIQLDEKNLISLPLSDHAELRPQLKWQLISLSRHFS